MDARERVRRFLMGGAADRCPFVPFVTNLVAGLAQVSRQELFGDPHLLTNSLLEASAVCGLDCLVLNVGVEGVGSAALGEPPASQPALAVVREAVQRLRALSGARAGIAVVLPGPITLASHHGRRPTATELEDLTAALLGIAGYLDPPSLDVLGVLEAGPIHAAEARQLEDALSSFWNIARYYSMPSLMVAAAGDPETARVGATAVTVWEGVSPEDLATAGARRIGVPLEQTEPGGDDDRSPPQALPPRPEGGFYTTRGEIPADTDVAWVQGVVRSVSGLDVHRVVG